MDTAAVAAECNPAGEIGGKPPDSGTPQVQQTETAPVMHTLQPVMTGPGGEQLGAHLMQPPMSMPVMMSPYQMMVFPQAVAQAQMTSVGSPAMQAQGSPAQGDASSRSGTPGGQHIQQQQHAMAVFSQGLPISQHQQGTIDQQAQLIQAVAPTVHHTQPQQDNGHASVTQSPVPQGSAGSQGSPAPATPGSMGSPMPPGMGEAIQQVSGIPLQLAPGQVGLPMGMAGLGFQAHVAQPTPPTPDPPKDDAKAALKPPKKPLTPYMRFSKSIWQQVKAANQGMSVCEIGATIGRMWRELGDTDKQHYNEEFTQAKARYDEELQTYLKITGLQASDLVKSKKKKESKKDRAAAAQAAAQNAATQNSAPQIPTQPFVGIPGMPGAPAANVNGPMALPFQGSPGGTQAAAAAMGALPHFSQVWTGQQQYMATVSPGFANGEGGGGGEQQMVPVQQLHVQNPEGAPPGTVLYGHLATTTQASVPHNTQAAVVTEAGGQPAPAVVAAGGGEAGRETAAGEDGTSAAATWHWQEPKDNGSGEAAHRQPAGAPPATDILSQAAAVSSISPAVSQPQPSAVTEQAAQHAAPPAVKEEGDKEQGKGDTSQAGQQYPSAHTLYNSYGYNPWSAYPSTDGASAKPEGVGKPVVSEREKALETEISHLKSALTEKTKEVKRLEQELHKAYDAIERLHQQHQQGVPMETTPETPQATSTPPLTAEQVPSMVVTTAEATTAAPVVAGLVSSSSEAGEVSSVSMLPTTTAANSQLQQRPASITTDASPQAAN